MTTEQRLEKLEAELRHTRATCRAVICVAAIAGVFAILASSMYTGHAETSDEIRAQRFVVVDGAGQERAHFGWGEHDESATQSVGLSILSEDQLPLATVLIGHSGHPQLMLTSKDGQQTVTLGFDPSDGAPQLGLTDGQRGGAAGMRLIDGNGALILMGASGRSGAALGIDRGSGLLELTDEYGNTVLRVP